MVMDTAVWYEAVKRDPLFAAEGMDLERAQAAVEALDVSLSRLQASLSERSFSLRLFFLLRPLARHAVPLLFLRRFVAAERARRLFLENPTLATQRRLSKAWQAAAHAYRISVRRYAHFHVAVLRREPSLQKKVLHDMAGNVFTVSDVQHSLQQLWGNANELVREATARLNGAEWRTPPRFELQKIREAGPLTGTGEMLEQFDLERLAERYDILERLGPVSYTLPDFDGTPMPHVFTLQICENRSTHEPYFSLFLADKFVFLPIAPQGDFGRVGKTVFEPVIERGIRFFAQQLTWFYSTRDMHYQADILTGFDSMRRPTLDRDALASQRSSLFDLVLWRCVDDTRRYRQMTRVRTRAGHDATYSLGNAFFLQINPSIYFLPFNRSVWRLEEPLTLRTSGRTKKGEGVYVSLEDISPPLTPEELRQAVLAGVIRRQAWKQQGIDLD